MALAIRKQFEAIPKAKPVKRSSYLDFIRTLPCAVTGRIGVEAAHLSTASPMHGHYGRGRGTKAGDRWCLPVSSAEHSKQHSMNEMAYWASVGIDPHLLALTLFGLWTDLGEDARPFAEAIINQSLAARGGLKEREYV